MANSYEAELERELAHELHEGEGEFEWESHEGGAEGEGILGAIGNALGGLLGEGEEESHEYELHELHEAHELHEFEGEGEEEFEWESHESSGEGEGEGGILGTIGNVLGGLLGEGEEEAHEFEQHEMHELHELHEGSHEAGEQFFGKIARKIGRVVKSAAPFLKRIAKIAAPIVGTAIGGPFGSILGKVASSALGEGELHELHELHEAHELQEVEGEGEEEYEAHEVHESSHEASHEVAHEIAYHETTQHEALAELMAEAAATEQHEAEAEAMAGAAVMTTISPVDRRALRQILPHLVRGVAILTRILRRRRITRPAVRAIPTIVRRTVATLKRQAAAGTPITRRAAGRAAAVQVRRVLGNPAACTAAIAQNVRANRVLKSRRPSARPVAG